MLKPIVCLSEQLCRFLETFRPCFSKRQWKYYVTVLHPGGALGDRDFRRV